MTNPMTEAAARAMRECQKQNWNLELGFDEDVDDLAQAAITAIEPMIRADERAKTEREIVEWLREQDGHGYDHMRADCIEAGEHLK